MSYSKISLQHKAVVWAFILFFIYGSIFSQSYLKLFVDSVYNKAIIEKKDTNQLLFLFAQCGKAHNKKPLEVKTILNKTLALSNTTYVLLA